MKPKNLTPDQEAAYKLLIEDAMDPVSASARLQQMGINLSSRTLEKMQKEYSGQDVKIREERMVENMLTSFERVCMEFEDSMQRSKKYMKQFEDEGRTFQAMIANRDTIQQSTTALKVLGKISSKAMSIKAKNINVIGSTDFVEASRQLMHSWFESMDASVDQGKLVFNKPSPEMLNDYHKWHAENMRKNAKVIDVGSTTV